MDYILNPFRNLSVSLRATGPAAAIIVWMICFTALGLFGGESAEFAQGTMAFVGGLLTVSLATKIR